MANLMKMKRSSVPGKVPTTADLALGEIAINTYDGKVYMKKSVSGVESIVLMTGAGAGDVTGPGSSGDNAIARFDGVTGKIIQNSSASIDDSGNLSSTTQNATGTGANTMPVGTTAQRPASPQSGMYRMNSTTKEPEWYSPDASAWIPFRSSAVYDAEYLVVAGGGGGGSMGGGGAGGYISGTAGVLTGTSYTVTIGAGGAGSSTPQGNNGSNSVFNSTTATGGGKGGGATSPYLPGSGGSGGGGTSLDYASAGGSGTTGQGNAGGAGQAVGSGTNGAGGGGGGANAAGGAGGSNTGGNGGAGKTWSDGVTYAGGGGGGSYILGGTGGSGSGGAGGGGTGGRNGTPGTAGTANTGGGGGAGGYTGSGYNQTSAAGGSGVVIIRYVGSQRGSGGTVTSSGGYTYHTFTSSGTFTA